MPESVFIAALQRITSRDLPLVDLIIAAGELIAARQPTLARQLYKVWIHFNREHPQLYVALFNCSALDSELGDTTSAAEQLAMAIAQFPDFLPAYINLGGILERSGQPDHAIEQWRAAANRSMPVTGNAVVYVSTALKQVARVLSDRQEIESAEAAVRHSLDIDPHQHDIIEQFVALRLAQCKWPVLQPLERLDRRALTKGVHPLSMAAFTDDPLLQLAVADRYVRRLCDDGDQNLDIASRHATIDHEGRRLRIGYVSSDLRDHAIGYLMAELFELHRKADVEVFAYYCGPSSSSPLNTRIKSAVEHWSDIRDLTDDEAARKIAADGVDILVDVNGHTRDARTGVFARRPAPIQVNWLGYPGTMGTPYHHYIIADEWIIPRDMEIYYSESVMRLPCYQANDRKRAVAATKPTRRDAGLPDEAFVFCCFNGTHKITRFTFERWLEILKRVPNSVLWLLETSSETKNRLAAFAERNGIDRERIIFAPKQNNALHLARYALADLFLDTAPYGAHTTASDALWTGVPVLTLSGRSFASRVCGSLVRSAGLADLVFTRPEDYVARAVALGNNRSQVKAYRAQLEANRRSCVLFDMEGLVARLEDLYRAMIAEYRQGRLPRPNLDNLDAYLAVGIEHDHDAQEVLAVADYHGMYKARLARRHLARPMRPDNRLWLDADVARVEGDAFKPVASLKQIDQTAPLRRMTATG